jgi:addiction module HigA family antidote
MPKTSKSRNTTDKLPPVHPGEILKETLDDLAVSMNRLAREIHVPANRISSIISGQRSITGETALRLARYFGTTPEYWLNMQARYDLETARDRWEDRVRSGPVTRRDQRRCVLRIPASLKSRSPSRRLDEGTPSPCASSAAYQAFSGCTSVAAKLRRRPW